VVDEADEHNYSNLVAIVAGHRENSKNPSGRKFC
jgi:hypothetical protein